MMAWYDEALESLAVPFETYCVPTRFGDTHVLLAGNSAAPPLVLLHGINVSALGWKQQIIRLAPYYRLIVPDVIGFAGRSTAVRLSYTDNSYALWLADVLDGLEIDSVALMGSSGGGHFALKFAAHFPTRVDAVALVNPCGVTRYRFPLGLMRGQTAVNLMGAVGHRFATEAHARRMVRTNASPNAELNMETVRMSYLLLKYFRRHRPPPPLPEHELRRIDAPVLLMMGDHDPYFTPSVMLRRARRVFDKLHAEIIANAGHDMHNDRADEIAAHVMRFLQAAYASVQPHPLLHLGEEAGDEVKFASFTARTPETDYRGLAG